MANPIRIEVNCETGVVSEIELTDAEVAQREQDAVIAEMERIERQAQAEALATLKASARGKLIAGTPLTEAEAAIIVL